MKRLKIGLNGFGRIGRTFARIALKRNSFDIVAVNTRKTPPEMLAYLLQYDSIYRKFDMKVEAESDAITISGKKIFASQIPEPENIPWDKYQVDVVVEASGAFTKKPDLQKHLRGSVKKVILTAPSKPSSAEASAGEDDEIKTIVLGVNDQQFDFSNNSVVSMASCTTNCAAPMFKILEDNFRVVSGFLTTAHAYTGTQNLVDDSGKKFDRARAAAINIVPSTTGAAKAVTQVIPELKGRIHGLAFRVPTPTVSVIDFVCDLEKEVTVEQVNRTFQEAAKGPLAGILEFCQEELVSMDFKGNSHSSIIDGPGTMVIGGNMVKILAWYDNEWGYSCRLGDLATYIAEKGL